MSKPNSMDLRERVADGSQHLSIRDYVFFRASNPGRKATKSKQQYRAFLFYAMCSAGGV